MRSTGRTRANRPDSMAFKAVSGPGQAHRVIRARSWARSASARACSRAASCRSCLADSRQAALGFHEFRHVRAMPFNRPPTDGIVVNRDAAMLGVHDAAVRVAASAGWTTDGGPRGNPCAFSHEMTNRPDVTALFGKRRVGRRTRRRWWPVMANTPRAPRIHDSVEWERNRVRRRPCRARFRNSRRNARGSSREDDVEVAVVREVLR
jgi:hypothetical protein